MSGPILELEHITKRFPGVAALDDVSVTIESGEVHGLVGENGAGKSTLVNIIAGVHKPNSGQIRLDGEPVAFDHPIDSLSQGIAVIHQELTLMPALSIAENIFLGRLPRRERTGLVDWDQLHRRAREVLERIGLELDPEAPVRLLSTGLQQQVEISRALAMEPKLLIMDEPTSALTEPEVEHLFDVVQRLTAEGLTVIFISHRLEEVREIAERLTVLRDGKVILTRELGEISSEDLAEAMLGHALHQETELEAEESTGTPLLTVKNLTRHGKFEKVSLDVHRGEIVGLAGLLGAGKTEVLRAIYGADSVDDGAIYVDAESVQIRSPRTAIRHGIYLVPEDRKEEGLVLSMSVAENITLPYLDHISNVGFLTHDMQAPVVDEYVNQLNIKTPNRKQKVQFLSGGNQQKIILARWLSMEPRILLLDQPTRGVDIGAKEEIYSLMHSLIRSGVGILFVATEMPEYMRVCDRIYVMRNGQITDELNAANCTERDLFLATVGGTD